jgi:hypothetical protein
MGHRLKVLWRAFKADFHDPDLKQHDKTILRLDKFEATRYPDEIVMYGMIFTADWRDPASEGIAYGGLKTLRLIVSAIDVLVADVFKICSWNRDAFMGTNLAALEPITRSNDQLEFLSKPSELSPPPVHSSDP